VAVAAGAFLGLVRDGGDDNGERWCAHHERLAFFIQRPGDHLEALLPGLPASPPRAHALPTLEQPGAEQGAAHVGVRAGHEAQTYALDLLHLGTHGLGVLGVGPVREVDHE
jgi:hypothetical protein